MTSSKRKSPDEQTQSRFAPTSITTMVVTDEDHPEKSFTIGSATVRELRFCDLLIQLDGYDARAIDEVTGKVLEEFDVLALLVGLRHFLPIVETHYEEMRDQEKRSFAALYSLMRQGKDVDVHPEAIKRAKVEFGIDLSKPNDDGSWKHKPKSGSGDATAFVSGRKPKNESAGTADPSPSSETTREETS